MPEIVSSFITFPNIGWWAAVAGNEVLILDKAEHFEKMSYRNRYNIAGANNNIQLSVPLVNGRGQRAAMADVQIADKEKWQLQHWRTMVSVYKRTPFFEHYEHSLSKLYETHYKWLIDLNLASIQWLKQQLKLSFDIRIAETFVKDYPATVKDIRDIKSSDAIQIDTFPKYYQLFEERNGFLPNLSMLDLLFAEGPYAVKWLMDKRDEILQSTGYLL